MDSNNSVTYNAGDLLFYDDGDAAGVFNIDLVLFQSCDIYYCIYSKRKKITHPSVIEHYDNAQEIFREWTLIA